MAGWGGYLWNDCSMCGEGAREEGFGALEIVIFGPTFMTSASGALSAVCASEVTQKYQIAQYVLVI